MQEGFLEEGSFGEKYMGENVCARRFLGDGSLGEKYIGKSKNFWVKN